MNNDLENVPINKFVMIAAESAEDPDNSKIYSRTADGFKFIINPIELAIFIPIITIFASILAIGIGIKSIAANHKYLTRK